MRDGDFFLSSRKNSSGSGPISHACGLNASSKLNGGCAQRDGWKNLQPSTVERHDDRKDRNIRNGKMNRLEVENFNVAEAALEVSVGPTQNHFRSPQPRQLPPTEFLATSPPCQRAQDNEAS
jgi:hypothetical protein